MIWHIVYTKPNHEGRVRNGILGMGYDAYLPLEERTRRNSRGQMKTRLAVMWPGYVFAGRDETQPFSPLHYVKGALRLIYKAGTDNHPAEIDSEVIDAFREMGFKENTESDIWFEPGERVRVIDEHCPFVGFEGRVVHAMPGKAGIMLDNTLVTKPIILPSSSLARASDGR